MIEMKAEERAEKIRKNAETVKAGDIILFERWKGLKVETYLGLVTNVFMDGAWVETLTRKEEFEFEDSGEKITKDMFPTEWKRIHGKKIPEIPEYVRTEDSKESYEVCKKADTIQYMKKAYEEGHIVTWDKNVFFNAKIKQEFYRDNVSYRLNLEYFVYDRKPESVHIPWDEMWTDIEELDKHQKAVMEEMKRISDLSDYQYSVEMMDKSLSTWRGLYSISDKQYEDVRAWLLERKNFEDVEVRVKFKEVQWKYFKDKKWRDVVCSIAE